MRLTKRGKRRFLLLVAGLVVSGIALAGFLGVRSVYRTRLAQKSREAGLAAHEQGEYDLALEKLSYFLARNRDDLEGLLAFADSRSKIAEANNRHLISAIRMYNAALQLDPGNREALRSLLGLYGRLGREAEALDIVEELLALDAHDIEALSTKVGILAYRRRFEDAEATLAQLIELQPEEVKWRSLLLNVKWLQDAPGEELLELCDQWIEAYAGDGRFHTLKVEALIDLGLIEQARDEIELAVARGARSSEVLARMLGTLDALGSLDPARSGLEQLEADLLESTKNEFPGASWVYAATIRQQWRSMRLDEAAAEVEDAHKAIGELDHELLKWKTLLHVVANERAEADSALEALLAMANDQEGIDRDVTRAWARAIRAYLTRGSGEWPAAREALAEAITAAPKDASLIFFLGQGYQSVEEHALAVQWLERAIELDPYWLAPHLAYAESLLMLGLADDALSVIRTVLPRVPDAGLQVYVLLARAWLVVDPTTDDVGLTDDQTGGSVGLVRLLEILTERTDFDPIVVSLLVEAYRLNGLSGELRSFVERASARDDSDARRMLSLVRAGQAAGIDDALLQRLVDRARSSAGLTLDVAEAQARLLHERGRTEDGLALIDEVWRAAPNPQHILNDVRRARAGYLIWSGHPQALAALSELLEGPADSIERAVFVLAQPAAWEDRELILLAIDDLTSVVGEHSPRVRLARAQFMLRFERHDAAKMAEATVLVTQVLQQTPKSLAALMLMSTLSLTGDAPDPDAAIRHLKQAVTLYPGNGSIHARLIALLQEQGELDEAELFLERLEALAEKDPSLRRQVVTLLQAQGDFDRAAARLGDTVDDSSPESDQIWLATLKQRAGRLDEAAEIFQHLLATAGASESTVRAAAEFYARTGRVDHAVGLLRSLDPNGDNAAHALELGLFYQRHGDLRAAAESLRRASELAPRDVETWTELAGHLLSTGEYDEARRAALSGLNVNGSHPALRTALALASLNLGESARDEVLALLEETGPDTPQWRDIITLYHQVTSPDGTVQPTEQDLDAARRLVSIYPGFLPAWRLAVTLYAEADRLDEAIGMAKTAAARLPGHAEPADWATHLLMHDNRIDEALAMAEDWRRRLRGSPIEADTIIAALELRAGRPESALQRIRPHADRIWVERDRFPDRLSIWLATLFHNGQFDRAATTMQPLLDQGQQWRVVWLASAQDAEVSIASRAIALIELRLRRDFEGRLMLAGEWLKLAERSGESAHFNRAIQLYQDALDEDPDNVTGLNNLAYLLLRYVGDCQEAMTLSARAARLAPRNADVLDTHAQALVCLNRLEEAEAVSRSAVAQRETDPGLLLTLARVLLAQDRFGEGVLELDRARNLINADPRPNVSLSQEIEALWRKLQQRAEPSLRP